MATTEERVDKLEIRFSTLEQQFAATMARVDSLIAESQQQREDIRRLQEKHDADMKAAQEKHNADIHEMNERFYGKIDDLSKQINDTWKQTMIGVGGMIIALGALLITALK